jgi:hypothetical protein
MNQYTNDELQLLAETYDLTVEELLELFDQGYTEEDLNNMSMSSNEEEEDEENEMEEETSVDSVNEEPDNAVEYEARMGLSLNDLLLKSVQEYTSKKYYPGGQANTDPCPKGYKKYKDKCIPIKSIYEFYQEEGDNCPPGYFLSDNGKDCVLADADEKLKSSNIPRVLYNTDVLNSGEISASFQAENQLTPFLHPYGTKVLGFNNDNEEVIKRYNDFNDPYHPPLKLKPKSKYNKITTDEYLYNLEKEKEKFNASQEASRPKREQEYEKLLESLRNTASQTTPPAPSTVPAATPSTNSQSTVPNPNVVDQTVVPNTTPEPTLSRRELRQQRIDNQMEPIESRTAPRLSTDLSNSPPRDYNFTLPEQKGLYASNREPADNNIPAPEGYYYSTMFGKYLPNDADQVNSAQRRYLNTPENEQTGFDDNEFMINSRYFDRYEKVTPEQFAAGNLSNELPPVNPSLFQSLYINDDPNQGEYRAFYDPANMTTVEMSKRFSEDGITPAPDPTKIVASPPPTTTSTTTPSAPVVQTPTTPSITPAPTAPSTPSVNAPVTPVVPPQNQDFLDDITTTPGLGNPDDPSSLTIESDLGPQTDGSVSQQALLSQQGTATAKENAVASTIEETDPYKGKDMSAFTDIGDKTRKDLKRERIADKVVGGIKQGAKYLFGSEQGQGMLMGLGNMATDALSANAMNQQLAGLKQARVFNINPDFFSGANPNIASSSNYDMSAAIYAEAGAVVNTQDISGKGEVPIEAEGGEFYFDPNSMATIPIQGPSHEKGGVKFNAAEGSFIFSDSEKISGKMVNEIVGSKKLSDKKEYTISDVIRALPDFFDTKKEAEQLTKTTNDTIRNASLKHNMQKKADNLSLLLSYQQKKNGNHGEEDEQQMMQEEQPMARRGMMVFDPGGEVTDQLQKDKKGRVIINGKPIGKEDFAKVKATPQQQALHARNLLEAAKSGKKYYIPKEGPYAGLPFDISKEKMEGPESRKGKGISEVFNPYADVETATRAAAAFTANPTGTKQYTTPGAPGYFAGGINPDLVEKKFGGRDKLLTALKLDPKNYSADLWNDPNFEKDFFKAFETAYVPKDKWRPVHGDDHFFGLDYYDFIKEPDKPPGTIPGTIPTIPGTTPTPPKDTPTPPEEKPGKLYEEKLTPYDYARFFSDVATIVPEEYLQQVTPRYKPLNLLTARDQINQAASTAAASNLSGTGVESIDAARQAAMYSGLLEQAGKATENVQNANRGIIDDYFQYNNAQFQNAQRANEQAKADFVQRTMQNQQAAQETRRQAQEDFAEKSRDVSQFNAGLRFNEGIYSPQYSTFVDENGFIPVIGRDGTEYKFNPATMMFGNLPGYAQSKVETEKEKKEKDNKRKGGKVKSTKRKLIK